MYKLFISRVVSWNYNGLLRITNIIVTPFRVFHTSVSRWFLTRVWVRARALLSILANLNNAVVWMVSTRLLISKSFSPCTNPLVTVPRAPISICITVIFMFNSFFQSPSKVDVLSFFTLSFNFTQNLPEEQNPQFDKFSFLVDYYHYYYYYYYYYYYLLLQTI